MTDKSSWERFFDAHAPDYDGNVFTKNTLAEVEFVLELLELPEGGAVLDVGCGTGRHAVELARRGYRVTGLDLSREMLRVAAGHAEAAGVRVEWVRANAASFALEGRCDGAICLCEGAFGLLGEGDDPVEQPLAILRNVAASLKPKARTVFTVLNAAAMIRRHGDEARAAGRFDYGGLVESAAHPPREGLAEVPVRERGFVPTELVLLFRQAGLEVLHVWGGTAGNWGRRPVDLDEIEIMVVARRPA